MVQMAKTSKKKEEFIGCARFLLDSGRSVLQRLHSTLPR